MSRLPKQRLNYVMADGRMSYCSKACQKKDWLNGHKLACCKSHTDETAGQFQGRVIPEEKPSDERAAVKLKELETNLSMIQLKLFLDHTDTILSRAEELDIPLYDCFVHFDLRKSPPTVLVESYTDMFDNPEQIRRFEESRSKENITCTYFSYFFNGDLKDVLGMQRFFPREWLMKRNK